MSTAGSGRSTRPPAEYAAAARDATLGATARRRTPIFRWRGIIPIGLGLIVAACIWLAFGEPIVAGTVEEAATKALGTQVDIAGVEIDETRTTLTLRGIAIADPFDPGRNLIEAGQLQVAVAPGPLLEKKVIIERLALNDVRTGTRRAVPARPVQGEGFAPRALREIERFRSQFDVPVLSLTPIDTIRSIVLDPTQLATVRTAQALVQRADSSRGAIGDRYRALRLQETLDSARALLARLQGASVRTLGVAGVAAAVADVRRTIGRVDSARQRVEALGREARASVTLLEEGMRSLDETRRADYDFARGLLKLPTFDAPNIGAGLFGTVTIDRFQQAMYWAMLAREHAPPGLVPRQTTGPSRIRRAGTTVRFVERQSLPRFLIRRANVDLSLSGGAARGTYALAIADATTEPAILGRPTLFALRRDAGGSDVGSLTARGTLDHVRDQPRDVFVVEANGVRLPSFSLPVIPLRADPGRGTSELRLQLDGDQISGRWAVRSTAVAWATDSATARPLNTLESLVSRVISGLGELDLTAELSGSLTSPRLSVRSNLDRAVADRVRAVAGEEIAKAEARVRAQVDRIVEERTAPVRAKIAALKVEVEGQVAEARARLDEERARLDARLRSLGLPGIGGW